MKCPDCEKTVFRRLVEERMMRCPECDSHFTLTARQRVEMFADPGSFEETHAGISPADGLGFVDLKPYPERLATYQEKTGLTEAIVTGLARVLGHPIVLGVMDSGFIMASMGSVVGEKVTRSIEDAIRLRIPIVIFCASGGARMQEGVLSLMQMAKTSAALARLHEAGGLYVSILTNPTTAGVMASYASLGDFVLAEPKALVGFTGPRVIKETIRAELPEGFQTSEFCLEHGFVDRVVPRDRLREEVALLIELCTGEERKTEA
jgi:acetyl-CoA carboxylase carboxyl transferase subunit beta